MLQVEQTIFEAYAVSAFRPPREQSKTCIERRSDRATPDRNVTLHALRCSQGGSLATSSPASQLSAPQRHCAYCYKRLQLDNAACKRCGGYMKLLLCSRTCQRADWKAGHKQRCGRSGELGADVESTEAPGKGLGTIALRQFERNEVVMIERPVSLMQKRHTAARLQAALAASSTRELAAFRRLSPEHGNDEQKFSANVFSCLDAGPNDCGVFINMSRINNDCIGNCSRHYDSKSGLRRLVASKTMHPGEELTIAYMPVGSGDLMHAQTCAERHAKLASAYSFSCSCRACTDSQVAAKLDRVNALFGETQRLGRAMQFDTLRACQEQLQLMTELQLESKLFAFVYSDMFQTAVLRDITMSEARHYAACAAEHAAAYYGIDDETAVRHHEYAVKPQDYETYCMADYAKEHLVAH